MAATRTRGLLQIGDVAERAGLSLRSVRHYEEVGLLLPADRSPGGFRLYTEAAVERLLVIKQMKPLEFTLEQMRELLDAVEELGSGPDAKRRSEIDEMLVQYKHEVERRVAKLQERLAGALAISASMQQALGRDVTRSAAGGRQP